MILRFRVYEQTISAIANISEPRQGSAEYLQLRITFGTDWENLDRTLWFLDDAGVTEPVSLGQNKNEFVDVPAYFTAQGSFRITLTGVQADQFVPTNEVIISLSESNDLWGPEAPELQPSWVVQYLDLYQHPPIPSDQGFWQLWNSKAQQYELSNIPLPSVTSGGGTVKTVNGIEPDENGNVEITIPDSSQNVELDTSLTQSGKAADAKAVGDAIANIAEPQIYENRIVITEQVETIDYDFTDENGNQIVLSEFDIVQNFISVNASGADIKLKILMSDGGINKDVLLINNFVGSAGNRVIGWGHGEIGNKIVKIASTKGGYASSVVNRIGVGLPVNNWGDYWSKYEYDKTKPIGIVGFYIPGAIGENSDFFITGVIE